MDRIATLATIALILTLIALAYLRLRGKAVAQADSSAGVGSHEAHATAKGRTGVALTHPDTGTRL
jgi:hypothetical protein